MQLIYFKIAINIMYINTLEVKLKKYMYLNNTHTFLAYSLKVKYFQSYFSTLQINLIHLIFYILLHLLYLQI